MDLSSNMFRGEARESIAAFFHYDTSENLKELIMKCYYCTYKIQQFGYDF